MAEPQAATAATGKQGFQARTCRNEEFCRLFYVPERTILDSIDSVFPANFRQMANSLEELNRQLKVAAAGVKIAKVGQKLYLRATLPPKPGGTATGPCSQRIALGVYENPAGLKVAKAQALKLAADLTLGRFSWEEWSTGGRSRSTVADWVAQFERDYFARRARTPQTETTWRKDYRDSFSKLPQDAALTVDILKQTLLLRSQPDTRGRKRLAMAYGAIAKFAGLEGGDRLGELRGRYSPNAVNPRDLPGDDLIMEWYGKLAHNRPWQVLYGLLAVYGLRPHEAFHLDLGKLREEPGICQVLEGKTGHRLVWPYPPLWWREFGLDQAVSVPEISAPRNHRYGDAVSQFFRRAGIPFRAYDLRHAWAVRTSVEYGLEVDIAARMMGHSVTIHTRVYHQFVSQDRLQAAVDRSLAKRGG